MFFVLKINTFTLIFNIFFLGASDFKLKNKGPHS